jgi:hypothetical protein
VLDVGDSAGTGIEFFAAPKTRRKKPGRASLGAFAGLLLLLLLVAVMTVVVAIAVGSG